MTRKEMDMIIRAYASAAEHYGYWSGGYYSDSIYGYDPEQTARIKTEKDKYWKEMKKTRLKVVKMMREVLPDVEL